MSSLLDIACVSESVALPKGQVSVYGVSAEGIAYLFQKFPEFRALITGREVTSDALIKLAPGAVAAIITCAIGEPGDEADEKMAARLPLECQMDILEAAIRLTMPNGLTPFVERLARMASMLGVTSATTDVAKTAAVSAKAPDAPTDTVKVPSTKSRSRLNT